MKRIEFSNYEYIVKVINRKQLTSIIVETGDETVFYPSENRFVIEKNRISRFLFKDAKYVKKIDLTNFDFSEIRTMIGWFYKCSNLEEILLPKNVICKELISLKGCFSESNIQEIDLSGWTFQSPISMEYFTQNCLNLEYVKLPEMQILNTDKAFDGCEKLNKVILQIKTVKDSKTPEKLFFNCKNLQFVDLSNAKLSNFLTTKETILTFDNLTNVPNNCVIILP